MKTSKNIENAENENTNVNNWPEASYRQTMRAKTKGKRYIDHFSRAVSNVEHELMKLKYDKAETEKRKMAITLNELIDRSEKVIAHDKELADRKKNAVEPVRYAGWVGSTKIFDSKEHYSKVPRTEETEE